LSWKGYAEFPVRDTKIFTPFQPIREITNRFIAAEISLCYVTLRVLERVDPRLEEYFDDTESESAENGPDVAPDVALLCGLFSMQSSRSDCSGPRMPTPSPLPPITGSTGNTGVRKPEITQKSALTPSRYQHSRSIWTLRACFPSAATHATRVLGVVSATVALRPARRSRRPRRKRADDTGAGSD
jgi:hypothetical protein